MAPYNLILLISLIFLTASATPLPLNATRAIAEASVMSAAIFTILPFPSMPPPKRDTDDQSAVSAATFTILPYPSMPPQTPRRNANPPLKDHKDKFDQNIDQNRGADRSEINKQESKDREQKTPSFPISDVNEGSNIVGSWKKIARVSLIVGVVVVGFVIGLR